MSMAETEAPIGVFDSGVGGLTVLRAIRRRMPSEPTVYLGDTARLPYGPKSPDTIRRYTSEAARFLVDQGVKAIVIACNTATAHARAFVEAAVDPPVIGVVEPGASAAVAATRNGVIGVIGTRGTIESSSYERAIRRLGPETVIHAAAAPLFVALAEEGWTEGDVARLTARHYLEPLLARGIDTLVLGCTHYPLLAPILAEVAGPEVTLIDSAEATATTVAARLRELELDSTRPASDVGSSGARYYVTDDAERFRRVADRFLGTPINAVEQIDLDSRSDATV